MFNKYPYTDNNQLNLDWFLSEFKTLYAAWVEFKGDVDRAIEDMTNDIDSFKDFVTTYLDNLDYSQAINDYIDQMVIDGRFMMTVGPVVQSATQNWLATHVTPVGSAVIVDDTLTLPGAAADAKTVGDRLKMTLRSINTTITVNDVPSRYADLTAVTPGSIILVTAGASALLPDTPFPNNAFTLITGITGPATATTFPFQIAMVYLAGSTESMPINKMAIRTRNYYTSEYNEWAYIPDSIQVNALESKLNKTFVGYPTAVINANTYSRIADFEAGSIHYLTTAGVNAMSDAPTYGTNTPMTVFTGILSGSKKLFQIAYPMQNALAGWYAIRIQFYSDETFSPWQYYESPMTAWENESTIHGFYNTKAPLSHNTIKLGYGDYHITSSITVPTGKTLEGCGQGTRIICHPGARVNLSSGSTVRNIMFVGYGDEIELTTDPPTTNYTQGVGFVASTPQRAIIEDCWFYNFSSAGIILYETGTPVSHNVLISNCFFWHCNRGLYIKANSEFHRITNCAFTGNAIGILTRGGNNNFVNCGIDANIIGIQFDQDEGSNNGHSLMADCTINHSDGNTGYGIIIKETGQIIISNCNVYYSKIKIHSSGGNIIGNCGFGGSAIEVTGAGCNIIHDNMFRADSNIYLPSNHTCKLHDNYYRNGGAINPIIE